MKENDQNYPLTEFTSQIIQAAITVHRSIGPGYNEIIYQRALSRQLWRTCAFLCFRDA